MVVETFQNEKFFNNAIIQLVYTIKRIDGVIGKVIVVVCLMIRIENYYEIINLIMQKI